MTCIITEQKFKQKNTKVTERPQTFDIHPQTVKNEKINTIRQHNPKQIWDLKSDGSAQPSAEI